MFLKINRISYNGFGVFHVTGSRNTLTARLVTFSYYIGHRFMLEKVWSIQTKPKKLAHWVDLRQLLSRNHVFKIFKYKYF